MRLNLLQLINRIEALSLREQAMLAVGLPLVLVVAGQMLVFGPAGKRGTEAHKQAELHRAELKALSTMLAAQPAAAPLQDADQLLKQRNEQQGKLETARAILVGVSQTVDWGTVVRATVAGAQGLTLSQLKTLPAEVVFAPGMAKPDPRPGATAGVAAPAPAPARVDVAPTGAAAPGPGAAGETVYRHRAELTVKGDFSNLMGYVQTLQRLPGDLRWDRLQLSVATYPQATVQLNLHTLSNRAETPFN